jgi:phage baseplate assembly protein W
MPIERVSSGFKDISSSFKVNPLNFDLIALKNETAIARSIRNLVLTNRQERFFNPYLGSNVSRLLFENLDEITASNIKDEIESTINNFEPRVELLEVVVTPNYDNGEFDVRVEYQIIGIDVLPQQLSFALQPTR